MTVNEAIPSVRKVKGLVAATIELKDWIKKKVKFRLNVAEVTIKIDTETSVDNFEIPNQLNAGDKVDVCNSTIDSEKYSYRYVKN